MNGAEIMGIPFSLESIGKKESGDRRVISYVEVSGIGKDY
tara:strand:- start:460 stop:579 length:120 start_codon:yes stop_codon:yes gene_type:complete